MSEYTECSRHGYYDNDQGCPECQDEQVSFALRERDLWMKQCLEAESRVKELENVKENLRLEIKNLLISASPHPTEHPTMHRAWVRATNLLAELDSPTIPNHLS